MDQSQEDVLSADVVVVQEASFLLSQNDDSASSVGEPFEQGGASHGGVDSWGRLYLGGSPSHDRPAHGLLRLQHRSPSFSSRHGPDVAGAGRWHDATSESPDAGLRGYCRAVATNPLLQLPSIMDDLERVEEGLRVATRTDDDLLTDIAGHLVLAGGKRLRPGFCIAAAACHERGEAAATDDVVLGGVSVELVHLGSLYHDDVMDEAATRRNVVSVNARWGNLKAILGGDFLLAKASEIAAGLGTEVAGLLAATIGRLCEGQVRELRNVFDVARSEDAYLSAIRGKTAALFASSCRIGALVAGHPRPLVDRLTTFGELYGMAFQVVDDVLDVVATEEQLGKPVGNDLVTGVYTLPVIRMLSTEHGGGLRRVLGQPLDPAQMESARGMVRANGAVAGAVDTARDYVEEALVALEPVAVTPGGQALRSAGEQLLLSIPAAVA
ncbi:MAG: polyprenyl synthetase family protein [Acidimicrobiia bacterium]|nr:polyprenyl synthetase family protein [Acidimicrobiia bacterium]